MGITDWLFGHRTYRASVTPGEFVNDATVLYKSGKYELHLSFVETVGEGNNIHYLALRAPNEGVVVGNIELAIGDSGSMLTFGAKIERMQYDILTVTTEGEIEAVDRLQIQKDDRKW